MKLILITVFIVIFYSIPISAKLVAVERLSESELKELHQAENNVRIAKEKLITIRNKIKKAHNMRDEFWPEWETWTELDGEFIQKYYRSHIGISNFDSLQDETLTNLQSDDD